MLCTRAALVMATASVAMAPGRASAEPPSDPPSIPTFEMPWSDRAPEPRQVEGRRWLVTTALGRPDPRVDRLSVRRRSARKEARRRAREALHRWVDDRMAEVRARPRQAAAVHRTVGEASVVLGERPLVEGAAVVMMGVPWKALRRATDLEGVPWAR